MPPKVTNMQKIQAICRRHADALGYELCDAVIDKEPNGYYLRIYIDQDTGITLDDCERYHRDVQPDLEFFDYDFLEVCSPGIDQPIRTPRDVEKSLGKQVEVHLYKPVNGQKQYEGSLRGMDEEQVVIARGEEELAFPRKGVSLVRLVPDLSGLEDDSQAFVLDEDELQ